MHIDVLGAGCLGLSAALALAERDHDVTVHDPRGVGSGATGKAVGIVSTMTWSDDDFHLVQRTRGRLGEVMAEAAMEGRPEARVWRSHDSIAVASGDGLRTMDDVQHRIERLGEETQRLDARAAGAQWPAVRFVPGEEVLVAQEDGAVEAGDLATLLAWVAQERGVRFVHGLHPTPRPAREATVVAAGAWTPKVLAGMGAALPLAAFRTQAASIAMERADEVPILHDTVNGFYVRPDSAGSVIAGDGTVLEPHDPDAYDEAADPTFREHTAQRIVDRLRGGDQAAWRRGWAGLCVGTPDRHPVCGRVPDRDDLFVLSGDNGFGVMRCLALGERLAAAVDGDETEITAPARFAGWHGDWKLREGFAW